MNRSGIPLSIALVMVLSGALIQCSDGISPSEPMSAPPPHVTLAPLNPSNPYDSVGIEHNLRVEFLFGYLTEDDTTATQMWAQLVEASHDLSDSLGWEWASVSAELDVHKAYCNSLDSTYDPIALLMNCEADEYISEREAGYIQQIGEILFAGPDSTTVINALLDLEDEMVQIGWEPDETTALGTIATAKHSFCFWSGRLLEAIARTVYIAAADAEAYDWSPYPDEKRRKKWSQDHSFAAGSRWDAGLPIY